VLAQIIELPISTGQSSQQLQVRAEYSPLPHSPQASDLAGTPLLRLGSDLLHQHLLADLLAAEGSVELVTAFRSPQDWGQQLRQGTLDAVLLSLASIKGANSGARNLALLGLASGELEAIPLGSQDLQLLYAARHLSRPPQLNPWRRPLFLLPPASCQLLLDEQLRRQALMGVRNTENSIAVNLVELLRQEPLLLPAHRSLLQYSPWQEAQLIAVPPPDPISDRLWLLVRPELASTPRSKGLEAQLRRSIACSSLDGD
jgi:hypothetical protein